MLATAIGENLAVKLPLTPSALKWDQVIQVICQPWLGTHSYPTQEPAMATILEFRASSSEKTVKIGRRRRNRRSAEIVIFPGVRYERWADAPDAVGNGGQGQVQRDRLQVVD